MEVAFFFFNCRCQLATSLVINFLGNLDSVRQREFLLSNISQAILLRARAGNQEQKQLSELQGPHSPNTKGAI